MLQRPFFSLSLSAESKIWANQCKILAFQFARNMLKTSPLSPQIVTDGAEPLREVRKEGKQIFRKSIINKKIRIALIGLAPSTLNLLLSTLNFTLTLNSTLSTLNYQFSPRCPNRAV